MAGDAVQRIRAAIEEEALLGVNREAAHAEALTYLVLYLAVQHQTHRAGVEIRVADAVPQVRVLQRDRRVPALAGQHLGTGGVVNRELDLAVASIQVLTSMSAFAPLTVGVICTPGPPR